MMKKRFWCLGILLLLPYLAACGRMLDSVTPLPPPSPEKESTPEHVRPTALPPRAAIRFETFNIEEGLSQSVVNAIVQDQQGFLWLGTQDGLNRYDGSVFKVYKPQPGNSDSLSDAWITELFVDKDGYLWIGTHQGGLNRYDPSTETFTRYRHDPDNPKSLAAGEVLSIYQDRGGVIWIGAEQGLCRFDPNTGTFSHYRNDPGNPVSLSNNAVTDIYQDSRGNLWFGTLDGLNLFDPGTGRFIVYRNNPADPHSLSFDSVAAIVEDSSGGLLWVGTDKGLNLFDYASGTFTRYVRDQSVSSSLGYDNIGDLLVDRNGTLWVGTDFGLDRFDAERQEFTHYRHDPLVRASLSENIIFSLYEDQGGVLWIGTWGGGVNKYDRGQEKFAYYRYEPGQINDLPESGIWAIYPEKAGQVWVGTFGSGLVLFDSSTGQVKTTYLHDDKIDTSLSSSIVYSVIKDSQGILWAGTANGLNQFDARLGVFLHYTIDDKNPDAISGNHIYKIYEDSAGGLWVGTRRGLDLYDRKSGKFIHYLAAGDSEKAATVSVADILEDRNGHDLWVATLGDGLYRLDRTTGAFEHFQQDAENDDIANNIIIGLYQDKQGLLWLSYGGGGLGKFDSAAGKFTTYTEADGLPNNFVYCAIPDDQGNLWLSTNYGISKFNPRLETFENFTTSDGLQSNEFNQGACARDFDQSIYFGGGAGLNRFFPEEIRLNSYQPPIAMTSFTLDGNPLETGSAIETTREITLKWPQNSFEFEFVALSFAESRKNQYAYLLENFDTDWNYISHKRDGRYTNLPGGEYTLRLKAANSDGIWNETGTSIKVTVVPPFWQTWWFYTLAGFVGIGLIWGGYRVRLHSIVVHRQELEREVRERTREIERLFEQTKELAVIEERNRLARELHDSAKQKAFAALAQLGTANGLIQNNTKAAKIHINEAENLVYDVIQELTFLIQEMYPLALKEKGLVTSLREYVFEWENRTGVRATLQAENERRLPVNIEQAIYRITQEALANVARHSHATSAEVSVEYAPGRVTLNVRDNGCGFDVSQKPNGVGLRSMRERAESMNGNVVIHSEIEKGTYVRAIIPITESPGV